MICNSRDMIDWANKTLKKINKITKFVINLTKIMEKAKKFQEMILIIIEIGPSTSYQEIWKKK